MDRNEIPNPTHDELERTLSGIAGATRRRDELEGVSDAPSAQEYIKDSLRPEIRKWLDVNKDYVFNLVPFDVAIRWDAGAERLPAEFLDYLLTEAVKDRDTKELLNSISIKAIHVFKSGSDSLRISVLVDEYEPIIELTFEAKYPFRFLGQEQERDMASR